MPRLQGFTTGSSRIPSDLARRTRPVWQYQAVPALSALLPALPGVSRIGLRSAPARLLRQSGEEVSAAALKYVNRLSDFLFVAGRLFGAALFGAYSIATAVVEAGGLVAFPTETVYGLGADATNGAAVARLYAAKGRPRFNPLISHLPDAKAARTSIVTSPELSQSPAQSGTGAVGGNAIDVAHGGRPSRRRPR